MSNIRDIKKDAKEMVRQFIQECYVHLAYSPPLHQENVLDIISDAVDLEADMLKWINHPIIGTKSEVGKYFKSISSEFYDRIIELTERLNSLSY